jgi:hypothetical protein
MTGGSVVAVVLVLVFAFVPSHQATHHNVKQFAVFLEEHLAGQGCAL